MDLSFKRLTKHFVHIMQWPLADVPSNDERHARCILGRENEDRAQDRDICETS